MAGKRISSLNPASQVGSSDLLPIVDIGGVETKKVSADFLAKQLSRLGLSVGATQPTNPYTGQPWIDTGVSPPVLRTWTGAVWSVISASSTSVVTSPATTAPLSPVIGMLWQDTSQTPNQLKMWDGSNWVRTDPQGITQAAADARYLQPATAAATYLPLTGGNLSGPLTLPGTPTLSNHAASKAYVDSVISGSTTTTWNLTQDVNSEKLRVLKWSGGPAYTNSRAALVVSQQDTQSLSANQFAQAVYFNFQFSGDGAVSAGSYLSQSIWQGLLVSSVKSGDGSGHCFTAAGELRSVGAGGYNELGMFVGEITNTGSSNGTMSGVEVLVKDGVPGGANYPTQLDGCIGRVAKFNASSRRSACFTGSSEGTLPVQAVVTTSSGGLNQWQYGLKLDGATFTSGYSITLPFQTSIAALSGAGTLAPAFLTNSTDTVLRPLQSNGVAGLQDYDGTTKFYVKAGTSDPCFLYVGGVLKRVSQGPENSGGSGYRFLIVLN